MSITKQRAQASLLTTSTTIVDAANPSGLDLGNMHFVNLDGNLKQLFVSIVPSGQSMTSGNSIIWGTQIGGTGVLSISQPMFMSSGDSLRASGSLAGLNAYVSYLKLS